MENERNVTDKITRICSACKYRKWLGDYALTICEITGKVIETYYHCDVPDIVIKNYIGECCRPKIKVKENNNDL